MYKIKNYSYKQAEKLNVIIKPSHKKDKKIDVYDQNGKYITSIGSISNYDYPTYIEISGKKHAEERRKLYKQRHKGENKVVNSAGYFAWYILW